MRKYEFWAFIPDKQTETEHEHHALYCNIITNATIYCIFSNWCQMIIEYLCLLRERLPTSFGLQCCSSQIAVPKIKT